jgi:undecaprenyl-diphosphatase
MAPQSLTFHDYRGRSHRVFIYLLSTWLFVILHAQTTPDPTESQTASVFLRLDHRLTTRLQGNNRHPLPDIAFESLALVTPVIETGVLFQLYRSGYRETGQTLAFSLGTTVTAAAAMKYLVRRDRPLRRYRPRLWNTRITPSFPSGHTASFAAFSTVLAHAFPGAKLALTGFTLLVGFSHVYVGNHYVGDVVAGIVLGYAVARGVLAYAEREHPVEGIVPARRPPHLALTIPL